MMSPFSKILREIRERRALRQKDLSVILGYEQSYISALETGNKGLPRQDFFNQLQKKLNLTESEQLALERAVAISGRTITIPNDATSAEFQLIHRLEGLLGKLSTKQIQLLDLVIDLSSVESGEAGRKHEFFKENRM